MTPGEHAKRIQAIEASSIPSEREQLRHRVRVEWDDPQHHDHHFLGDRQTRPYLVLSGRLELWDEENEVVEPFTWIQGARILVEKVPGTNPDWTQEVDPDDTLIAHAVVSRHGTFEIHVEPWKIQRVPGEVPSYRVAICLPDLEPGGIWRNIVRPLPRGVTALRIPGPPVLSPTLALINASPRPIRDLYDPVALVRVVNHLRELGKEDALSALTEYANLAPQLLAWEDISPVAENLDTADSASVFFIVRLLFEPNRARPQPLIWSRMMGARAQDDFPGGHYPFIVAEDTPFLMASWRQGRSGSDISPMVHIAWAEEHGRLRSGPLRPPDDPHRLVEAVGSLPGLPPGNDPRQQVRRAVGRALGLPIENSYHYMFDLDGREVPMAEALPVSDEEWAQIAEASRTLDLRWDEVRQDFVSDYSSAARSRAIADRCRLR